MMRNIRMEQLSLAYIRSVAAEAGYQVTRPEVDNDSVDGVLMSSSARRPRIDFQAKATARENIRADGLHFRLPLKNYNDLRADTRTPRILVVMVMPESESDWLTQTEEELCLRYCCYWVSLAGQPPRQNTSSVTVQIPVDNVFNKAQLEHLMAEANEGRKL